MKYITIVLFLPFITPFWVINVHADERILDNLIVNGSTCIGDSCNGIGIDFGFDSLILKSETPQIVFNDTSSSSLFASTDWRMGVQGSSSDDAGAFFIENVTEDELVFQVSADGDVAIGAGAEVGKNAVSFGTSGYERRITYVADGVDDTDAVTFGQFDAYKATLDIASETDEIDAKIAELEMQISKLSARLEAL